RLLPALEVDAQEEAVREPELGTAERRVVRVDEWRLLVQGDDLRVLAAGVAGDEAELVERQALLHPNRKGARDDLQEAGAFVPGGDLVEAEVPLADDPGEDVDAAGRALGIRPPAHVAGERDPLRQRDEVRPVPLEDRALPDVELRDRQVAELRLD